MRKDLFKLDICQLKDIAESLKNKIEKGLAHENTEIQCFPTYIQPNPSKINGKALVMDLGGTNYRAAIVDFSHGIPRVYPEHGNSMELSKMKNEGFTKEDLFKEMVSPVLQTRYENGMPVGYCFSYPMDAENNGDAVLKKWTKGVNISGMVGERVGAPFLSYLNELTHAGFSGIKVINDTVASLFAGLTNPGYDAHIGLIVGSGFNIATFVDADRIPKLETSLGLKGKIPVNLEAGNFYPPHLTPIDDMVDVISETPGEQRFEKAVSGFYLGEVMKRVFPLNRFEKNFDAKKMTTMIGFPDIYKEEYVQTARKIYQRSAQLVAASLAGVILLLREHAAGKRICITAEGSLFWSKPAHIKSYKEITEEILERLLTECGCSDVQVVFHSVDNANLIGAGIAALS